MVRKFDANVMQPSGNRTLWFGSPLRRAVDIVLSLLILGLGLPVLIAAALAVLVTSGRPVLFTHMRVGRGGKLFRLYKFRSMRPGLAGAQITAAGDSRITRVGKVLRRYKIDELPQFWNVLIGDMSIVGPRPEVPRFVDKFDVDWRKVLRVAPGITDPASIAFRNEEELLAQQEDPESYYRDIILPCKLEMSSAYIASASLRSDLRVILETARCAFKRGDRRSLEAPRSAVKSSS